MHSRIDSRCRNAFIYKVCHLVLHQCDERRDDKAQTFHRHGWHLEANALAATRGQQRKRILPCHHRVHDVLLKRTETGIAPILLQYGSGGGGHNYCILSISICN